MSSKHAMIMLLCCLVPLAAIFLVSAFNISLGSLGTLALVLMCPLMHLLMMRGMSHSGSQGQPACDQTKSEPVRSLPANTREG